MIRLKRIEHIGIYLLIIVFVGIGVSIGTYLWRTRYSSPTRQPAQSAKQSSVNQVVNSPGILKHVFIILEENKTYGTVVGNSSAPYINSLLSQGAVATNYHAVTHPSLPNYLALTSGSTNGVTTDCNPPAAGCELNVKNIADEIEQSGRTWKEYAETMPSTCYMFNSGLYDTKHNPFVYYDSIINNASRCNSHVVPFSNMLTDLKSVSTTPNYAFITPNDCNDGEQCSLTTADSWLKTYVPIILSSKAFKTQKSLLVIVWDEGYLSSNHVLALFLGNSAKPGFQTSLPYNHYSLLHTIEQQWSLAPLTSNDANALTMTNMIK